MKFYEYKLINYFDVWGNKEEGYEVNNLCDEGNFHVAEDIEIIKALKKIGFLLPNVRKNQFIIEDMGEIIEISHKKSLQPICRLELIQSYND